MGKAIIFDVDGTLVDSVDLHARAWQDAFRAHGREIAFDALRAQIGKGGDQLLPVFLDETEIAEWGEALQDTRQRIMKQEYLPQVTAFPGVRDLFQRLLADGWQIALASSAKEDELATYKRIARIDDLVQAETSSDDAERSKPHPDIFQAAMARLHDVRPDGVLVVGDTPHDAEAARKAGLRTIGLLCGGWSDDALRAAGCVETYRNPADLLARRFAAGSGDQARPG